MAKNDSYALKIQCVYRIFLARRKIKKIFIFKKSIRGWHHVNNMPLNEAKWEEINEDIVNYCGDKIMNTSSGSHLPGRDLTTITNSYSNKTAKLNNDKKTFSISSYRLSSIISQNKLGSEELIKEKLCAKCNFNKYSLLLREEDDTTLDYYWLEIPSNYIYFNPETYSWSLSEGKILRTRNTYTGWETNILEGNCMKIVFSMSSQLWITINFDLVKEYILARERIDKTRGKNLHYYDIDSLVEKMEKSKFF